MLFKCLINEKYTDFARKNSRVTIFIYNNSTLFYTSLYVRQHAKPTRFDSAESWVILSNIEQRIKAKIEAIGTPLKDWNIQINYGIKTGFNDAFIINGEKRAELIAKDPKSAEIIRPILRGRDIKRYGYDFADLYLINTHNGVKEKGIKRIHIEDYPAVKAHLDLFYPEIEKRADQGDTPYNLRNCAYIEDFYKQKIVWASIGETSYSIIPKNTFLLDTNYFFSIKNEQRYLLAILNSKLITYWINSEDTPIGNGGAYRHYKYNLERLPIAKISSAIKEKLSNLLDNQNYREIDKIIYILYDINEEEILFIEAL